MPFADAKSLSKRSITRSLYYISHHAHMRDKEIERKIGANENGMIVDEGDKWYINPDIYHIFSLAQDPRDLAFRTALRHIKKEVFREPVDLGSGTGRFAAFLLSSVAFEGQLACIDASEEMCHFLESRFRREGVPESRFKVLNEKIEDLQSQLSKSSSDLVVANFSFPSKLTDRSRAFRELKAVYEILRPDGFFVTVGWDETFNDELSEMWYKYIPDGIKARNFEEWRSIRTVEIASARNCGRICLPPRPINRAGLAGEPAWELSIWR